jgi:hypothetical protein
MHEPVEDAYAAHRDSEEKEQVGQDGSGSIHDEKRSIERANYFDSCQAHSLSLPLNNDPLRILRMQL